MSLPFVNGGSDAGAGDLSMEMMKCTTLNSTLTTPTFDAIGSFEEIETVIDEIDEGVYRDDEGEIKP